MNETLPTQLLNSRRLALDDPEENQRTVVAKVTAMCVLFVVSTICGLAPFKLSQIFQWGASSTNPKKGSVVSLLLSFGGGVLLATTFLHLLPDVQENIAQLQKAKSLRRFPFGLGEFLACTGFFLIFLVEEIVHSYIHRREQKLQNAFEEEAFVRKGIGSPKMMENNIPVTVKVEENGEECSPHHHSHSHIPEVDDSIISTLRGLLIVMALSIHELFEGLAVGLEVTANTVWMMFIAISAHKFCLAFCIGVELVVSKTKLWLACLYIVIYSIVSAIGILIGLILVNGSNKEDTEVVSAVLQGLAAGTLLYVVFYEILCDKDRKSGIPQYLAVLTGFAVIFLLQIFTEPTPIA